ncbi:MAG: monovalent cation/H+ antiporter complex subunit F [Pseudonocardia sp.]|nr:monovalent cation/H+ antiporter complex subunit F [Pseudonocardia sp.]
MNAVFGIVLVMLLVSGLLTLVRLFRGPHTLDRIAALDVFVVLIVAATAVYVAYYRDTANIALLVAFSLVAFVGSASAARLTERRERHR